MESFRHLLKKYTAFKSVSADKHFESDIKATIEWLKNIFKTSGFSVELWDVAEANQVVFASYEVDPKAETILVYGHYDVQPASGWKHDPFLLREEEGRLMARGVVDNKGQNLIHIAAVAELIQKKKLGYNVKFLLEGNEETGSKYLPDVIEKNKNKLRADHILISDGEIVGSTPVIEAGLRGSSSLTLTLRTAPNDLHSGIYGGAVPNAAQELSLFLGKLFDQNNSVQVPGFYDDVDEIPTDHKRGNKELAERKNPLALAKTAKLLCEAGNDFYTQTGLRPTMEITGIKSGYTGEGYSNIVPAVAEVRINIRYVDSQKPDTVTNLFEDFVKKNIPDYVEYAIKHTDAAPAVKIKTDTPFIERASKLLEKTYGEKPIKKYSGGTIPVVGDFKSILGVDPLLIPLGNDDCNMHGVDENFRVDLIEKGLAFSKLFFAK
jgi:acetylornithine deacetylase/succinyl-diaminopimelate desuccinylase-like protein